MSGLEDLASALNTLKEGASWDGAHLTKAQCQMLVRFINIQFDKAIN